MTIIKDHEMVAGTVVEYKGPEMGRYCQDVTVGKRYTIEAIDEDGEPYFIDDAGERNWSASEDGSGSFELVSYGSGEEVVTAEVSYTEWWSGVREWVTLLSAEEREALAAVVKECDEAMKKIACRG